MHRNYWPVEYLASSHGRFCTAEIDCVKYAEPRSYNQVNAGLRDNSVCFISAGQEVASYWYSAVRQYNYTNEPDVLHANVNAGNRHMHS